MISQKGPLSTSADCNAEIDARVIKYSVRNEPKSTMESYITPLGRTALDRHGSKELKESSGGRPSNKKFISVKF